MKLEIKTYSKSLVPDVLDFEKRLREEEQFWGWEINDAYRDAVESSFDRHAFDNALSLLAYVNGRVVGRIDASLIPSHFDGSIKAYLDWICVIKSSRHQGVAQALMNSLRKELRGRGITTLIALTAANDEAQRFYQHIPNSFMRDTGIWIDV
ncbi:MAG: GNAT family N-acetyltransferase [Clostridia bacterium]|nr:GNAT family N-acetyltransferase [Clostridia bacterium]